MKPQYRGPADFDGLVCPYGCPEDTEITDHGTMSTLVGFSGGPENDGNHHETSATCTGCGGEFTKHFVHRGKKVWYTDHSRYVLLGNVGCCETSYRLPCEICKGWLTHSLTLSGGGAYKTSWRGGKTFPDRPHYWQCNLCEEKFPDLRYGEDFMTQEQVDAGQVEYDSLPPDEPYFLQTKWTSEPAEDLKSYMSADLEERLTAAVVDELAGQVNQTIEEDVERLGEGLSEHETDTERTWNKLRKRYANKQINPNFYGTITIGGEDEE